MMTKNPQGLFIKFTKYFFILTCAFSVFSIKVKAQEAPLIDWRCSREQLFRSDSDRNQLIKRQEEEGETCGDSLSDVCEKGFEGYEEEDPCWEHLKYCYANSCCVENNTQAQLVCLELNYPAGNEATSSLGEGGVNFFRTDFILNKKTLPIIIRMVLTVIFAAWVIYKFWDAIKGFDYWLQAANSGEDAEKAKNHFTHAMLGSAIGVAGVLLTTLIFKLGGYDEPFNFDPDIDRLLDVDCVGIRDSAVECEHYDLSCDLSITSSHRTAEECDQSEREEPGTCEFTCTSKEEVETVESAVTCWGITGMGGPLERNCD
ncbi:hypothetical protein GF362_04430 [Candidatus Dojkabacteria bacterium]|nr:hypothetical protein [Candidatus Dojkabacteria bacterium]